MIENRTGRGALWNALLALALTALFFAVSILLYEYTYGVIDDPFIATVLNGAYTGTPDAHVVYIKYPLAWLLTVLFRLIPGINWHFLLLTGCFAVCVFSVSFRICSNVKRISLKLIFSALFMLLFWLCMAKMILTAHYSMCAATLAAAGIFHFATIRYNASRLNQILNGAAAVFMLWVAYALRARTVFMLLPLAGILFLYKFFREKPAFRLKNLLRWLAVPAALFIGLGAIELLHNSQYQSAQWKAFLSFNDARTTLYDFYGLPEYTENRELYESLNISGAREYMYEKYYLELTDGVPEDALNRIADARVAEYAETMPFGKRVLATLKALPANLVLKTYAPVNWICAASFIIIMLIALIMAKWRVFLAVLGGILATLIPWLWMIYMGKPTSRVTMGIWAADLLFLTALLIDNADEIRDWVLRHRKGTKAQVFAFIASAILGAALIFGIAKDYGSVTGSLNKTIESGQVRSALEEWCERQPENLYICESGIVNGLGFDVKKIDNSLQNLYWPGGWPAKMAQSRQIWERFGFDDVEKAIAENRNVFIIAFTGTDMSYWTDFYSESYPGISLKEEQKIKLNGIEFTVYYLQERTV